MAIAFGDKDFLDNSDLPNREKTWADHDEPWQYASYHLTDFERYRLIKRRDKMIREEHENIILIMDK